MDDAFLPLIIAIITGLLAGGVGANVVQLRTATNRKDSLILENAEKVVELYAEAMKLLQSQVSHLECRIVILEQLLRDHNITIPVAPADVK